MKLRTSKKEKLWLLIPALWACIWDIMVTVVGQPKEYWSGNLNVFNEGNPIGALFMSHHVSGLFILSGMWIVLIIVLGYYLPRTFSRIFLLFIVMAHSWGISTWIPLKYRFAGSICVFMFHATLFIVAENISFKREPNVVR